MIFDKSRKIINQILMVGFLISANTTWAFTDIFPQDSLNDQNWFFGEELRNVSDEKLSMQVTGHGNSDNTGFSGFTTNLKDPADFNSVSVDITVNDFISENGANMRTRVAAYLFNDGTLVGTNDIGNIFADVGIYYDGTELKGFARVIRCTAEDYCDQEWDLLFFDDTSFGNAAVGVPHTVSMSWDPTMKKLDFSFNGTMVSHTFPMVTAINPVENAFSGLAIFASNILPGPQVGNQNLGDGQLASMNASYDNVFYNGALYDDFSANFLDVEKWGTSTVDYAIDANENVLNMFLAALDGNSRMDLTLKYPNDYDYLQTSVKITESEVIDSDSDEARIRARVAGYWYDDGTPGDGDTGEVYAEIRLIASADQPDNLVVQLVVFKCGDDFCDDGDLLLFESPVSWSSQADFNKTHVISVQREAALFTFGFDGQFMTHDASAQTPTVQDSQSPWKTIGLRIDRMTMFDSAFIGVQFDNVLTTPPQFVDVASNNPFLPFIELLADAAVTGGCGTAIYCPNDTVTREQMAVFLEKSSQVSGFTPPPAIGMFTDVPVLSPFAPWIEQLFMDGITGGCGTGIYCPKSPVTREQMAVFLLKAKFGSDFMPPPADGDFGDVPISSPFASWIEELALQEITGGCGGGNYCPKNPVTRAQMAVFLVKAFDL